MSQSVGERADDPEEVSTNSSEITSSGSCTTSDTSTTASSSVTSTTTSSSSSSDSGSSSSSSDADDDNNDVTLCRNKHRLCQESIGHLDGPSQPQDVVDSSSMSHDGIVHHHLQQSAAGQQCDISTTTNVSCSSKSGFPVYSSNEQDQKVCSNLSKIVYPNISSRHQNTPEVPAIQNSLANSPSNCESLHSDKQSASTENHQLTRDSLTTNATSLGSSYSNLNYATSTTDPSAKTTESSSLRRILKLAPSPSTSMSNIDTNNNKNSSSLSSRDGLTHIKRTNFSKSASGSRLLSRSRPNVCDCLSQDCGEKKHTNRRQFIEHYYNSRTQLPTANTSTSSFNISSPLNRLSECDAIMRRLLSSPIRAKNIVESPIRRIQVNEVDKSRRASLGTNSITDQIFLFSASNSFRSSTDPKSKKNQNDKGNLHVSDAESAQSSSENDFKLKQQGRSLSVCDEETLNPRQRVSSTNYSSNLNRAISLACETGVSSSTRRLLTIIPLFGCDIKSLEQFTKFGSILPPVIDSAVDYILINGINSIGIFRKSGVKSRILTLKQRIEANQGAKFDEINQNNEFSIYDIADLVKMWFRELKPLPLMTKELIKLISSFLNSSTHVPQASVMKRGNSSQQDTRTFTGNKGNVPMVRYVDENLKSKIDSMTTPTHRILLLRAFNFLAQISTKCEINQMTSQNLAICLTPSLCATESDQNSILFAQKALEYCIDNHRILFSIKLNL